MKSMKRVTVGAIALVVGGVGFSSSSYATVTSVYGAGSSLVAPYARQEFDCYGTDANLYFQNSTPTNAPTITNPLAFIYNGHQCTGLNPDMVGGNISPSQVAPFNAGAQLNYESTGSGTGIKALYRHDATAVGALPSTWPSAPLGVQFGFAETSLDSTDVSIYTNGNDSAYNSGTNMCTGNTEHVGLCIAGPGETPGGSNQYPNPAYTYGALIQIPMLVTPVAIAYDPVYKKTWHPSGIVTYKFNIKYPNADGSGGLRIDQKTFCKIFNGQIINWNDPALKALNGNQSLEDPTDKTPAASWSVPLQIVGRSDSSGTTGLFTRHAATICPAVTTTPANAYTAVTTTLPGSLIGGTYVKNTGSNAAQSGEVLGKFTVAAGSDGVAQYVGFTLEPSSTTGQHVLIQGRMGYVGPDYTLPSVTVTQATPSVLATATLKNASNQWVEPTAAGALAAFGAQLPPQSTANGTYSPGETAAGLRSQPYSWVQPPSTSSYLADPVASGAYPITGTSNMIAYTCYSSTAVKDVMTGYLHWYETNAEVTSSTGILSVSGFAPVPKAWRTAILGTFVTPNPQTSGLHLYMSAAGAGSCTAGSITGG